MMMFAKVRLLTWMATLAVATALLLGSATSPRVDDPARATMAAVQVLAGVLAAYLFVATLVAIRLPRLAPAFVQRLVAAAIGTGIALAPIAASAAPARPTHADAPVLHRLPDEPSTTTSTSTPASGRDRAPEGYAIPPRTPVGAADEVTVAPGDHLWGIAERTVTQRLGRAPSDDEVARYWNRLIEANRDRLATGDPDLIFSGQVFRLPS
jgi:hypothetical protein